MTTDNGELASKQGQGGPWDFLVGGEESIFAMLSYTGIQKKGKEKRLNTG